MKTSFLKKPGVFMKTVKILLLLASCSSLVASQFSMNVGADFNYARYELDNIAQQSGYLAGPHFDISYEKPDYFCTALNFDGRWNAGLICSSNDDLCNNSCLSGGCLQANVADYITDWTLGYYYLNSEESFSFVPFAGVGFYHLSYEIDPSIMRYKYYQVYVPVGVDFSYHSLRNFSIGTKIQYRAGVYNRLRVSTPCVSDDCDSCCDDKIALNYSQGFNIKVPVVWHYRVDKPVGFYLSCIPFFDWHKFADTCDTNSDCVVFPIPENKRWYLGVNANFGITF
jgi:hypothetical protein